MASNVKLIYYKVQEALYNLALFVLPSLLSVTH